MLNSFLRCFPAVLLSYRLKVFGQCSGNPINETSRLGCLCLIRQYSSLVVAEEYPFFREKGWCVTISSAKNISLANS